jgi:hypothetical protein
VYDESGNKELEDDRDSQDEVSALPPSRYVSRAPSIAPSRTHSASDTPQTLQSPADDRSTVGTLVGTPMSRSHSTSQPHGDGHPDGYTEPPVSKKSKSSGSHSHHGSSSQQLSPNPSTVSHRTSRSERSQHSPSSSQHPSQHSNSPREPPRDTPQHSPSPRELSHPFVSHPISREHSQLGHQSDISTPASTVPTQHHDREISRGGLQTPNYYASTPTQSHTSQPQQPSVLPSVLNDTTSSISRAHGRPRGIVDTLQPPEPPAIKFPSVSTVGSSYETPVPRSTRESRTTSLTPSDSASNVPANYHYGNGIVPGTTAGSVAGSLLPEPTPSRKSKKDKNRSLLSTIASAANFTAKPPTEQLQPPEPAPSIPQISISDSPSVSSSLGGSRLTTNPSTPIKTRSLKPSFTSSLSYATNHPEQQQPPEPPVISRQNSDSVVPGGLGGALGGVLTNVWGAYKSASASPVVENPPHGPVTAAYEATLETIPDVEFPGGFGGEREREAPVPPQEVVPEPIVTPPSPQKVEEPAPGKVPTPRVEVANLPAPSHELETETVPQTPIEPEQSVLSVADKKKAKKQRKEKEAQEKKEREEREQLEREEREAQKEREALEEKKRLKAEREAKKKEREERERVEREREAQELEEKKRQERAEVKRKEREEQKRQEQERAAREAHEQAEREARERAEQEARAQAEREAGKRVEREARERAEREANERAERIERAEREAREAQERAEREAKEQAKEKMDRLTKRRNDKEAAKQEAERVKREAKERAEEAVRVKAEKDAKRKEREAKEQVEREKAEQEAREEAAREKAELEAKKAEEEAKERADREARENAERVKAEREAMEEAEREKERLEKEREAKDKADREAKQREEEEKKFTASKIPSPWGSTVGRNNDSSRKTSGFSQKGQKNEWGNSWDFGSAEKKDDSHGLPPIITSSVPGGIFDGAGNFDFLAKKDSPGGAGEEVELRTPLTKKGKNGLNTPPNLSKAATPSETVDMGGFDNLEHPGFKNRSARASISSENERFTDAEQGPASPETVHPALTPEVMPEAFSNSTSELLKTPQGVKEEVPTTPKPWPAPSLTSTQSQVSTPAHAPAKTEPEKPLSLWERKKPKGVQPASASNLFGSDEATNSSGVWGDAGGGGNTETIAMPTITGNGDRQSIFTDTARDQKRENQRENLVEGFLGSNQSRRRNDSPQQQMASKPTPRHTSAPAPAPAQKSSGWGSWGSSLLNTVANVVTAPDRTPSPEPPSLRPKIEDPPRGFTPNQPPKSQPAGFGSSNKPAWSGTGGSGENQWGGAKNGPTPLAQKTSTGPAWGAKPVGGFGPGTTAWGNAPGPTFGSGVGKNLTVDTTKKPMESSPNTAGPENIPESAVEIKHVPAPGTFHSSITEKKDESGERQDDGWEMEGDMRDDGQEPEGDKASKDSKPPLPVQEKASEQQAEETEEPTKTEETATPPEDDDFEWANTGKKKKKKGQAASVAQTPSVPNTPDPDNADDGTTAAAKKKKKKGGRR